MLGLGCRARVRVRARAISPGAWGLREESHTQRERESRIHISVPSRLLCSRALVSLSLSGKLLVPTGP